MDEAPIKCPPELIHIFRWASQIFEKCNVRQAHQKLFIVPSYLVHGMWSEMEWFVIVINILGPGRINLSLSSLLSHPHLSSSMADKLKVHFLILCVKALFTPGRTLRNLSSSSFRFLAHYLVQEGAGSAAVASASPRNDLCNFSSLQSCPLACLSLCIFMVQLISAWSFWIHFHPRQSTGKKTNSVESSA